MADEGGTTFVTKTSSTSDRFKRLRQSKYNICNYKLHILFKMNGVRVAQTYRDLYTEESTLGYGTAEAHDSNLNRA